jgi:hypothetical protein
MTLLVSLFVKWNVFDNDIGSICVNQSERDLVPADKPISNTNCMPESFKTLDHCDVYNIIQRSAKKSCTLDPMAIPTNFVCDFLDVLMPVIFNMMNTSLSIAQFPEE